MRAAPVSVLAASLALAPACGGGGQAGRVPAFVVGAELRGVPLAHGRQALAQYRRRQPGRRPPDARGGAPGRHRRTARDAEGPRRRRRRRRRGRLRRPEDGAVSTLPPGLDPAAVRAVAMDLDRTILADNLEFSPAVVRAVGRLGDAGHRRDRRDRPHVRLGAPVRAPARGHRAGHLLPGRPRGRPAHRRVAASPADGRRRSHTR